MFCQYFYYIKKISSNDLLKHINISKTFSYFFQWYVYHDDADFGLFAFPGGWFWTEISYSTGIFYVTEFL